jgi:opacity protein-like surface antigen
MKRFGILLVVMLVSCGVVFAAEPKPIAYTGAKALMFDLGGLANLAAGDYGGGLGFKYYLGSDLALRMSLGFNTSTVTTKNLVTPLPATQMAESRLTHTDLTLGPAVTYNFAKVSTVAAYAGGMFFFTWAKDRREGNSASLAVGYDNGEAYRSSSTTVGFGGLLGVEWWPWENVSLSAEYRLGYSHTTSETESSTTATSVTVDGPTTNGFGLGSANSGALTLAIYF